VREPGVVSWLATSIVLSVVLTVIVNLGLRAFPDAGRRAAERLDEWALPADDDRPEDRRARVVVPWKAMLIGSLVLTLALNLLLRIT
jgi:hypothetical protein